MKDLQNVYERQVKYRENVSWERTLQRLTAILFMHALETKAEWYIAAVTKECICIY